jgi:hypothetical protein
MSTLPLQFLLLTIAGWMTRDSQRVTEDLLAENTVLREQLRGRRVRYTDAQRRRLPGKRRGLLALDVTPDPIWSAQPRYAAVARSNPSARSWSRARCSGKP